MIEGEPTKTYAYTYGNAWKDQLAGFDGGGGGGLFDPVLEKFFE